MCGFAGFLTYHGLAHSTMDRRDILRAMGRAIAHRGPDDEQFYDDGTLALVFRRLSIIDVGGGRQPLFNDDGSQFVVVNGEIYNHEAIRSRLASTHRFRTRSDCEVALHLLSSRGAAGLQQMNGMFAMAFWDKNQRRLLLARDRLGIKPLYVAKLPGGLLFGSELKALLAHPHCPRDMEWSALNGSVAQLRSPVATYVQGIEHLPGGHWLEVTPNRHESHAWWKLDEHFGTAKHGLNAQAYTNEYRELLETSAIEHLLSDVPVGLHLSGGLDSSLLAALSSNSNHRLSCFSVVERNSLRCGDVDSARRTTERLRMPWYPILFDHRTLLDEMAFDLTRLEQSVFMMDSPRFDPEWIFKEELHRAAKRMCPELKVVLLGQGADEFAGGYSQRADQPRRDWSEYLVASVIPNLTRFDAEDEHVPERLRGLMRASGSVSVNAPYHRMMRRFSFQLQHFNLWHEDRTSMFQSLEARVPYLDHRLVELLASIPSELHETLFWNKQIVRDVAKVHLPTFDPKHPKVPFFVSSDMRSIDIMVHVMLQKTLPAFISKYLDLDSFPFDPAAIRALASDVLGKRGSFYRQGWVLMELMVTAIFREQILRPDVQDFHEQRVRRDGPGVVSDSDWPMVQAALLAQPNLPSAGWTAGDRVRIPAGAQILQPVDSRDSGRYLLCVEGGITSEVRVPAHSDWMPKFLRNLNRQETSEFTVSDWEDELELAPSLFRSELEALHSAGFVLRADAGG